VHGRSVGEKEEVGMGEVLEMRVVVPRGECGGIGKGGAGGS
jgi:hypothetical protein